MDKIRIKEEIHYKKMGSKHPMSLRLKIKQNWANTSYYFNSKNGLHEFFEGAWNYYPNGVH